MPTCADAIEQLFANESGSLTAPEVIDRLYARWPDRPWKETTIRQHLVGMSFNHTSVHHMPQLEHRRFLHWTRGGHYRRWDVARDGAPSASPSEVRPPKPTTAPPEEPPRPVTLKPWVAPLARMLDDARALLRAGSDEQQKRAFLEIDGAVELLFKGYVSQPGSGRRPQARDFPEWLVEARLAAGDALKGIALDDILWYHRLRNTLQHEGSGITVERKTVEAYLAIVEALLRALNEATPPRVATHNR